MKVLAHLGAANTDLTAVKRTSLAAPSTRHAKDVIFQSPSASADIGTTAPDPRMRKETSRTYG